MSPTTDKRGNGDVGPRSGEGSYGERLTRIETLISERERSTDERHKENQRAIGELRDAIQQIVSLERTEVTDLKSQFAQLEDELTLVKKIAERWEGRAEGAAWATRLGWALIAAGLMIAEFFWLKWPFTK